MAWTAEQLAELENAYTDLLTGRNTVRLTVGDRTFEFGPGDDGRLERLIAFVNGHVSPKPRFLAVLRQAVSLFRRRAALWLR